MTHHLLEKEIFKQIQTVLDLSHKINQELSTILLQKEIDINVELTQELKERCTHHLTGLNQRNSFACKYCFKTFDDGRKLGGHVSKSHKGCKKSGGGKFKKRTKRRRKYYDSSSDSDEEMTPELKSDVEVKSEVNSEVKLEDN